MVCGVCAQRGTQSCIIPVREMMQGTRHVFHYMECRKCGCLQLLDPPADMSPYYAAGYYSLQQSPEALFVPAWKGWLKKQRDHFAITGKNPLGAIINQWMPASNIELYNLRKAGLKTNYRILDVGSGGGMLTYIFYNAGFTGISGIDPYLEKCIVFKNGLCIDRKNLHDLAGEAHYDAIFFHHSFEHMPDPQSVLRHVHRLLKPGGKCVIRIPTCSSFAWQHYRQNWVQIDAPRHYFLYSIKSLRLLASQTGFEYQYLADESTAFQFTGSEQYTMDIPLHCDRRSYFEGNRSLFSKEQIAIFSERAKKLNQERQGDSISAMFLKN